MTKIKIFLKLSIRLLLDTLIEVLDEDKNFVIFTSSTIGNSIPDIILVDLASLDILLREKYRDSKIVLIDTGLKEEQILSAVTLYNLSGVIATYTDINLFKKALRVIMQGQIWVDNRLLKHLIHEGQRSLKKIPVALSEKEKLIIQFICEGLSNKEIAARLSLSPQTIKTHLNRIFKKLGLANRFQLASLFSESQSIDL